METLSQILQRSEYAAMVAAKNYTGLRDSLNDQSIDAVRQTFVTELQILATLGPANGEAFLDGIESVQQPVMARVVRWIRSPQGIDIGNADVRTTLDQLVASNVVTAESAGKIKALAVKKTSVAERDYGRQVTEVDVMDALSVGSVVKHFDAEGNEVANGQPYAYTQEVRA